ncbi:hypothetical protein HMPREF9141_0263 [Prevotella multiformis DSM 16608]|uniref:Uncharacterized protein n=1 Tax=Prevotella multiformis DSM 16608 TaxID=888743 RepID=F0F3U7_9BACT|nr:hypothetical protein HMPREF9141_0263 [Prevotella multiformis DSM 16608]
MQADRRMSRRQEIIQSRSENNMKKPLAPACKVTKKAYSPLPVL